MCTGVRRRSPHYLWEQIRMDSCNLIEIKDGIQKVLVNSKGNLHVLT